MHSLTLRAPHRFQRHALSAALLALSPFTPLAAQTQAPASDVHLPQVVVSATRHALPLLLAPASVAVVSSEQVAQRGSDNLLQLLRADLGIQPFAKPVGGRKALSLRGMDPRHTLVLVDGQRISASDGLVGASDFQLDWTGAVDIQRVEVLRGPMSVLYGAEALGGVIQVITQPLPTPFEARAFVEGRRGDGDQGSGHRAAVALRGGLGLDALRAGLSVSDARRSATALAADPSLSAVEGRAPREVSLRLEGDLSATQRLRLDLRRADEQRWMMQRERTGQRRLFESRHQVDRELAALRWDADWGDQRDSLLRIYRSELAVANTRSNGVTPLRPNTLRDEVVEGQASSPLGDGRATLGFEWRDERVINIGLSGGEGHALHRGVYGQWELPLSPHVALTSGLRWDEHSRFGGFLSPRSYLVAQLGGGWVAKGGFGRGFKAPTVKQIDPSYREDEGPNTFLGNPDLRPEVSDSAEVALALDRPGYGLSATLFRNEVRDLINSVLVSGTPARGTYRFNNVEQATLQGLELQAGWRPWPWLNLQAHATLMRAKDGQGVPLDKRAERLFGLRADVQQAGWGLGVSLQQQAGLYLAGSIAGQAPQPVPTLNLVNVYGHRDLGGGWRLRAGVDNAGNLRLAAKSPLFSSEELPRTVRLSLEARW
ncbi:TonB-dependent receptor plug domain-containing protein [Inhella sp.]|uniref:TonB-dependent receptor plug domain-containing protein n=1 Tax=Inhella sp. TaxID=1921806 RepID=UPI0035B15153